MIFNHGTITNLNRVWCSLVWTKNLAIQTFIIFKIYLILFSEHTSNSRLLLWMLQWHLRRVLNIAFSVHREGNIYIWHTILNKILIIIIFLFFSFVVFRFVCAFVYCQWETHLLRFVGKVVLYFRIYSQQIYFLFPIIHIN